MGLDILLETNVYIDNLSFVGLNTLAFLLEFRIGLYKKKNL